MKCRWFVSGLVLGLAAITPLVVHAQDFSSIFGDGGDKITTSLEQEWQAPPPGYGQLWIEELRGNLSVPVLNTGSSSFGVLVRGQRTRLGQSLSFQDRAQDRRIEIPAEFGTIEVGPTWVQTLPNGEKRGAAMTYGSAGRRLLDNAQTPILTMNFFWEKPSGEGRAWVYFLNYSNNRTIMNHVPLPGFAYVITGEKSRFLLGIPFLFAMWRPDPFSISGSASPFGVNMDASYRLWGPIQVYSGALWRPKAYQNLVSGSEDRLIFDRKEWSLGLRSFLSRQASASVGFIWSFDRHLLLGRSRTSPSSQTISIPDSGGIQARLRFSF